MFAFLRKTKISCQELADKLAPGFTRTTIELFEGEKQNRGEHSWILESIRSGKCRTEPVKEWVLLSIAAYVNGCRSSMKQDTTHYEFVRKFIAACGRDFIERGIFSTAAEYSELSKDRISNYFEALAHGEAQDKIQAVARKFLVNVGCNPDDIVHRMGAAGFFVSDSANAKNVFDQIQKSYRVVA